MPNLSSGTLPAMTTESPPVLPRLRTDVPPEVAAVPAPPLPRIGPPYALRRADPSDAGLLSEWMNRPHLAAAWQYDWPTWRWRRHLEAQVAGTYSLPIIGSLDGRDCAYLELYRAAKDSISAYYDAHPHDVGVHAAIADPDEAKRGLASVVFAPVVVSVFAQDPQCRRIMFDPDHTNVAARHICEAVGCTFLGEHDMPNRRMTLYAFERPAAIAPPPEVR